MDNIKFKHQYVKPGHPNQCQEINKKGEQCLYHALPGQECCAIHSRVSQKKVEMSQYLSTRWRGQLDRHANHTTIYNLREDIGVLRIIMETTLSKCEDEDELIARAPTLADLVMRIERVVNSSVKLEQNLRNLLDAKQVQLFADSVINAVSVGIDRLELDAKEKEQLLEFIASEIERATPALEAPPQPTN